MSYVSSLYHVVFGTYERKATLNPDNSDHLYALLASEIKKLKSKALIINGVKNHLHILLSLSPQVSLSDLMREIKSHSSIWAKQSGLFPLFDGWAQEYGAFSLSASHKDAVYKYIENQQIHHLTVSDDDEFERLVTKAGLMIYRG
ncbi:MAG: transposase [Muribaculaceae bacterium]|nr:transposase [Muribaculaceae bacterium]